jgi:hypothetical protein
MEYVAHLPNTRKMLAPAVALVIGAAGAVGAYALTDDSDVGVQPTRVIVADSPAEPSRSFAGKDEAATAAAIGNSAERSSSFDGKDEAATAAAIGSGIESQNLDEEAEKALRTDPHGQKWFFRR